MCRVLTRMMYHVFCKHQHLFIFYLRLPEHTIRSDAAQQLIQESLHTGSLSLPRLLLTEDKLRESLSASREIHKSFTHRQWIGEAEDIEALRHCRQLRNGVLRVIERKSPGLRVRVDYGYDINV